MNPQKGRTREIFIVILVFSRQMWKQELYSGQGIQHSQRTRGMI